VFLGGPHAVHLVPNISLGTEYRRLPLPVCRAHKTDVPKEGFGSEGLLIHLAPPYFSIGDRLYENEPWHLPDHKDGSASLETNFLCSFHFARPDEKVSELAHLSLGSEKIAALHASLLAFSLEIPYLPL